MTEKNKIYNAADFDRYYTGAMPANEMHALEKAALEDPFLADALEGYGYASSVENDIAALKERLNEKRKKKKVFSISSIAQSGWWRIAALLIIIAGAGYVFYLTNNKNKEDSIAKNVSKSFAPPIDSSILKADTNETKNDLAFEGKNALKNNQDKKRSLQGDNSGRSKNVLKPLFKKESAMVSDSVISQSPHDYAYEKKEDTQKRKYDKTGFVTYNLKGKITDEKGKPLAFATIKNNNEETMTDTSGQFLLSSKDSITTAVASAAGYSPKSITLQNSKEPVIAMNKSTAGLSEVVVTGYGEKRKFKNSRQINEELSGKPSGLEITPQSIAPVSNTEKFNQYLEKNLNPVYDENNKQLAGEVFLSFKINKKGRPKNIKVIKSSCEKCEAEAIQLLSDGPDWTIEKDRLKTVVIKF